MKKASKFSTTLFEIHTDEQTLNSYISTHSSALALPSQVANLLVSVLIFEIKQL